MNMLIHLTRL